MTFIKPLIPYISLAALIKKTKSIYKNYLPKMYSMITFLQKLLEITFYLGLMEQKVPTQIIFIKADKKLILIDY